VRAVESSRTDSARLAKSVTRNATGQVEGSTKDPVKEKVLDKAKKADISERTAERALSEHRNPQRMYSSVRSVRRESQTVRSIDIAHDISTRALPSNGHRSIDACFRPKR
jgi:hypothetical protein